MGSSTPKDKNVSMLKSEKSSSHSWWWDSHNSPKCSKWLQSNLQDLDGKVKEMLRLIEEDADSFAQRAEMYYQKRPELINLVEEFYRAYRSLAERYDHLQGEIRQNIPRALRVQYGLSCDSPNKIDANKGEHIFSPLRKSNQLFESLLEKACQIKDPPKESDQIGDFTGVSQENSFNADEKMKEHDYNDAFVESSANSSDKEDVLSPSSSDSEVDNLTPFKQLQLEMKEMKDKNKGLVLSHMQALEINAMLQSKLRDLETGYRVKEEEVCELQSKILELNAEVSCLPGVLGPVHDGSLAGVKIPQESLMGSFSLGADEQLFKSCSRIEQENCHLEVEMGQEQELASYDTLQEEVGILREENRMQKLVILASGEEKREVIRQLSISWEMLKNENQRLEEALRLLQNRLHVPHAAAACGISHSSITIWKQLFALMGFKNYQPYVAVAL